MADRTWGEFARALLAELGAPISRENIDALLTWMAAEQPPTSPNAWNNPLNIQSGDHPHEGTSGTGQYNFATFGAGVRETAAFMSGSNYARVVEILHGGNCAPCVLQAVQDSRWSEVNYGGRLVGMLAEVQANRERYEAGFIAGSGHASDLGGVQEGFNNPILDAPGNALDAIAGTLDPLVNVGKFFGRLLDVELWKRIGLILGGVSLLLLAWSLVNRDALLGLVGARTGGAASAASVAGAVAAG